MCIRDSYKTFAETKAPAIFKEVVMSQTDAATEPEFAAFIAIDWADRKHAWSLQVAGCSQRESGEIQHTPEAVEAWVTMLSARFAGQPMAVALEQSQGALVFMLGKYGHLHVYPIHPRSAAQFRAALYPYRREGRSDGCGFAVGSVGAASQSPPSLTAGHRANSPGAAPGR